MRKIISLISFLLPILAFITAPAAFAAESGNPSDIRLDIRSDAPDRHVVVKGDTLWDISAQFFKDPWKWPNIWGFNKDTIKDPHWIYPGDIIYLDRTKGTLHVGPVDSEEKKVDIIEPDAPKVTGETKETKIPVETSGITKLSPRVRDTGDQHNAIPSIPANIIAPFLSRPLVIEEEELNGTPVLVGAREGRTLLGANDTVFATALPPDKGDKWQLFHPGKTFVDPETREVLGIEAVYLGDADVKNFADVSTLTITRSILEIRAGDRLAAAAIEESNSYLPRAPESKISASIISIYGGLSLGGQNAAITLNKGHRDGLEIGHVLALYRKGEAVKHDGVKYQLPDERYGLAFVFRVFNKVSYALVMQTKLPVQLMDSANTP